MKMFKDLIHICPKNGTRAQIHKDIRVLKFTKENLDQVLEHEVGLLKQAQDPSYVVAHP